MKQHLKEFFRRGCIACGIGPLVLVILYLILQHQGKLQSLTVNEVCLGIVSLSALAFIVGGMNVIYQIEQLPLMEAVSIHGSVLYVSYLATYLFNSWLEWGFTPILTFSAIFLLGYLAIWAIIYTTTKKRTEQLNKLLKQKQQTLKEQ